MKKSMHAKRMERHHKRLKKSSKLNLVSLMDIFTILVFFLLVNSSDVEVLESNKSIKLPESLAEQKPSEVLVVMVDAESIIVNGRKIADVAEVNASSDLLIPGLKQELEYQISRKQNVDEETLKQGFSVNVMADKATPYTLLKKIMSTCAKSDYRNIALAVSQIPKDTTAVNADATNTAGG
jgi:biopolymer transport protein ExbD